MRAEGLYFTHLTGCTYRKVLVNEGSRQKVEVEHEAGWRFLMFHGSFKTRLLVEQVNTKPMKSCALCPVHGYTCHMIL